MDIAQYTSQTLLGPRNAALDPVPPVARRPDAASQLSRGADAPQATNASDNLFGTVLDTLNPLQHIPGINGVYREVTGDTAAPLSSMAGGFLFGGPIGLAAGAAGSFLEMLTGKSLMGHAMALFSGETEGDPVAPDAVQTAALSSDPLFSQAQGIGLKQYQAFAQAASSIHQGIGASATEVGWAENVWTQQALKQATSQYENSQHLSGGEPDRTERIV